MGDMGSHHCTQIYRQLMTFETGKICPSQGQIESPNWLYNKKMTSYKIKCTQVIPNKTFTCICVHTHVTIIIYEATNLREWRAWGWGGGKGK